jgi:hypothetical protein
VPGEDSVRKGTLERRSRRAVADDDEPSARHVGERREVLDLLLGGEAPHVADDRLAGCDPRAPGVIALARCEPLRVDTAPPATQAVDSEHLELPLRCTRRREREGGAAVQPSDMASDEGRSLRHPVLVGVGDHIGLVDGDGRNPQGVGSGEALPAEHERRREVHDVGAEIAQDRR